MSILTGFKKQKEYSTDANGNHKLVSRWTHADTVEVGNDGAALSDVFEYDANNQEVIMQEEGYDTVDGGSKISIQAGGLVQGYRKKDANNNRTRNHIAGLYPELLGHGSTLMLRTKYNAEECVMNAYANDINLSGTYNGDDNTWDGTNTSLKTAVTNIKESSENYHIIYNITASSTGVMGAVLTWQTLAPAFPVSYFDLDNYYISSFWLEKSNNRIFYDARTSSTERIMSIKQSGTGTSASLDIQTAVVENTSYAIHMIFRPVTTGTPV